MKIRVITTLQAHSAGMRIADLARMAGVQNQNTVKTIIKRLHARRAVERIGRGVYRLPDGTPPEPGPLVDFPGAESAATGRRRLLRSAR